MHKAQIVIKSQIGDLSKWTWQGGYSYHDPDSLDDQPKCLCGKPLIHCFIIKDDKDNTAIVGSECVTLFKRSGKAQAFRMRLSDVMVKG